MPRGKPAPSTHGLRIGGVVIPLAALTDLRLTEAVNDDAKLAVTIAADARVDLRGAIVFDGPGGLHYEGWVTAAQPTDNGIEIQARSAPWLDEGRFPGWLVRTKVEEAAWSAGRLAGLRPDQINIPTLQLAREGFLVVAPVVDVVLADSVIVGGVAFSSDQAGIEQLLDFVGEADYRTPFLASGVWAISQRLYASSLFDAEQEGIAGIDGALDRLALDAHFSSIPLPDGRRRPFDRRYRLGNPRRADQVLVRAQSGRAWLRTVSAPTYEVPPARESAESLRLPLPGAHPAYDLALAAWRRAIEADNRGAASVALWEALEFYTAGATLPTTFDRRLVGKVVTAASSVPGLMDDQADRIGKVLRQFLNMPDAMVRLEHCLRRDEIPFTDVELAAIRRVREPRSLAQHGRPWTDPTEEDLELSLGFVNRVLAYWGDSLTRP